MPVSVEDLVFMQVNTPSLCGSVCVGVSLYIIQGKSV